MTGKDGDLIESDDYLAEQLLRSSNVILASTPTVIPPELFLTNAMRIGDITAEKDSDGVLRRVKPFRDYRLWHPLLVQISREAGFDLAKAEVSKTQIRFVLPDGSAIVEKVSPDEQLDLNQFVFHITGEKPANTLPTVRAFETKRVWQLGLTLAAHQLEADLATAKVTSDRIVLKGKGVTREIPLDQDGMFYINWKIRPSDNRLTIEPIESILQKQSERERGGSPESRFRGKLVVIGSTATGNDLTDRGATPLENDTFLVSKHWNIANSILTGAFIRRTSTFQNVLLIIAMGITSALLTWKLRALSGSFSVVIISILYTAIAVVAFIEVRLWLPIVLPVIGAKVVTHVSLVTWRAMYEQKEKRRIKNLFSKIVSPSVVNELLKSDTHSLGGARKNITIYFADIRGFTEMTDAIQARAEEFVRANNLSRKAADAHYEESARETLATVNLYLATVSDIIKKHNGTVDKYIGDCVMAFWGAPVQNEQHALFAVRAAVEAQRAIERLNVQRSAENKVREEENKARIAAGKPPRELLATLSLGSGINTGVAVVGLMGADESFNYTVFGREVNLASRLEGVSGRGRIIIGEATYRDLVRDDPKLAATCIEQEPVHVKGIRSAVKIYEVPWKTATDSLASVVSSKETKSIG